MHVIYIDLSSDIWSAVGFYRKADQAALYATKVVQQIIIVYVKLFIKTVYESVWKTMDNV